MDSKQVVEVLKACKGLNLKELVVGDLIVSFQDLTSDNSFVHNSTKAVPITEAQKIDELLETKEVQAIADEFETANMMANDPVEYEKYIRDNQ